MIVISTCLWAHYFNSLCRPFSMALHPGGLTRLLPGPTDLHTRVDFMAKSIALTVSPSFSSVANVHFNLRNKLLRSAPKESWEKTPTAIPNQQSTRTLFRFFCSFPAPKRKREEIETVSLIIAKTTDQFPFISHSVFTAGDLSPSLCSALDSPLVDICHRLRSQSKLATSAEQDE